MNCVMCECIDLSWYSCTTIHVVFNGSLMYTSIFSRPIALNTAAQWHTGHVTGAPHREAETGGETVCLNECRRHCMIVVVYKYQKWTAPRTSHFGGTRVNVFVRDCETLGSESERLLLHSYHILKLRQCDGTEHRKKKKSLSLQLKSTVDSLREKHSGAVLIIHTLDETHRYVPLLRTMPITFTCSQTSQRPIWATVKNITEQLFTHQYFATVY